jgi:hypothetical protein
MRLNYLALQSYLAATPFAKVARAFKATGFSELLDASGQHIAADRQAMLFAPVKRLDQNHGHLLPSWLDCRKDNRVDL